VVYPAHLVLPWGLKDVLKRDWSKGNGPDGKGRLDDNNLNDIMGTMGYVLCVWIRKAAYLPSHRT
jgi:hypothetical protein